MVHKKKDIKMELSDKCIMCGGDMYCLSGDEERIMYCKNKKCEFSESA
jgi:hypothetical protein